MNIKTPRAYCSKLFYRNTLFVILSLASFSSIALSNDEPRETENISQASDYFSIPYLPKDINQGIILVEIDQTKGMLERAYSSENFDAESRDGQVGYFNPLSQYRYHSDRQYFEEDLKLQQGQKDAWDGQFLNWLLMRQIDMARYFLLGVQKKQGSNTRSFDGVIDLDASEQKLVLKSSNSRYYSPIPNAMPTTLGAGQLSYQGKTFQLRLKNPRHQKGLLGLLTKRVKLYFYSQKMTKVKGREKQHFIFGDAEKMTSYLKGWSASSLNANQSLKAYKDDTFLRALEAIKQHSLKNKSTTDDHVVCQRYVHLSLSSNSAHAKFSAQSAFSAQSIFSADINLLNDCQKDLKGKQALTHFDFITADKNNRSVKNTFTLHDTNTLLKSIFRALSGDGNQYAFQIAAADMAYFPDQSGVIYQSLFKYALKGIKQDLNWLGDVRAILVDAQGRLRSDNGDQKLGSLDEDPVISSCFDEKEQRLRVRFLKRPGSEENCNQLNYPYFEKDIGTLWRASDSFNKVSQASINRQRYSFQSNDNKRYIRTHIGQVEYDFVEGGAESGDYTLKPEWLNVRTQEDANKLINYVRGQDQQGFRPRQTEQKTLLLGDTTNSSPLVVGQPSSNYHLLYGDQSYQTFLKQYQNRRARVFVGSNDGMLHSFNAGWFDSKNKQLKESTYKGNQWDLGQETWAFVPFSVLPYLSELSDMHYGISPYHHLSLAPQTPYIFDAKIFDTDTLIGQADRVFTSPEGHHLSQKTHPEGWGTLMVVGVGLGASSYLVFDITDAEQAPKMMAELQLKNMGNANSLPSVMTQKNKQGELEWNLVLGSGTDLEPKATSEWRSTRSAGIYVFNLHDIQSEGFQRQANYIDLKESMSYVTGISAADWDLDGETDSLYLNTASVSRNTGSLYRVNIRNKLSKKIVLQTEKLLDVQATLIERPQLSMDNLNNRWIYLATGQSIHTKSIHAKSVYSELSDQHQKNKIIGLKEPRNTDGDFLVESSKGQSGKISLDSLIDVSHILVNPEMGNITGSWQIRDPLKENTINELEKRLMRFTDSSSYIHGWLNYLDKYEASTGASKLFGGILTQASHQVEYKHCRLSADAFIHRLRFTTGTAWYSPRELENKTENKGFEWQATKSNSQGSASITSILLHAGDENIISQIQSSENGNTQTSLEDNRTLIRSGEVSWREL